MSRWWAQFNDPVLAQFIAWAESDSPSLTQSWAKIEKARATLTSTRSDALPSVTGSAGATRSKQVVTAGQTILSTSKSVGLDASWELDLFGKVRRDSEAASARVDARVADWHDARVSLAAEVADTYVQYRACELLADAYDRQLISTTKTAEITNVMVTAGLSAASDGALARASLASGESAAVLQHAQCELQVKSLVALTGRDEQAMRDALAKQARLIPQPAGLTVNSVPADVVRQRPDLASLERELAASSAEIGAAKADLYPSLSLSGSISRLVSGSGSPYNTWSFGPQLSLQLFDRTRLHAAVDSATASYESALAGYRQGVRTAVKEVEQALINLDSAARRAQASRQAADEYRHYFDASEASWRAGTTSLLSLEEARRSALSADINNIALQQNRVSYWIALYKALGGGWQAGASVASPAELAASDAPLPAHQGDLR